MGRSTDNRVGLASSPLISIKGVVNSPAMPGMMLECVTTE